MSGGSYNYLYQQADHFDGLVEQLGDLDSMADRLRRLGYADAAADTQFIHDYLRHLQESVPRAAMRLTDVWHAVEWLDSGDSGIERVGDAINEYREGRTP